MSDIISNNKPSTLLIPAASLWRREVIRFLRQRSRVVGAFATPLVFWLLLGSGMRNSFTAPGTNGSSNYLTYSFPGMMVLIVMFTAIFSTISIIEDRREGFMQSVLVAPVRRSSIVLGKVLGSTTLAVVQALVFMLLAPLANVPLSLQAFLASSAVLIIISLGLSALGVLVAWPMESTQGFHAVMNLFLMPMWMISGAMFPLSGASHWLAWIMRLNPLTYGVSALRYTMTMGMSGTESASSADPSLGISLGVSVAFAAVMFAWSSHVVTKNA